jgi:hypothetical protein
MAYTANRMRSASARLLLDFDPDSGSETIVDLVPGATGKLLPLTDGYERVLAGLFHSVGTGTVTTFKIFVADDVDGATNATTVVSHALGSVPDAVGDTVWLEASGEQLRAASATAAYVGVKITLGTSTDECVVYFERAGAAFKSDNLTADYVS